MRKTIMNSSSAIYRSVAALTVLFIISTAVTGCVVRDPPQIEFMENYFQEKQDDILLVTSFLLEQEDTVYIIFDGTEVDIWFNTTVPEEIQKAIMRLKSTHRIIVCKTGDTIYFDIWSPAVSEKSSGIAYSISDDGNLDINYLTTQTPMSESGWYYYVSDFNAWRAEQNRGQ